ncbi:hybrid sensor histidine kinase/response regulator transcription factor [Spirosoma sp. KNUC1025]|uniref:hybrid sensor histidine kinase/response regulator transcription factor n=1 Tax=Spirosoma sp. KNUC1025 TaxID=2894082 RepID=UPI0038680242|nr:response regulator [Spirosoma sp. KNUC1025]
MRDGLAQNTVLSITQDEKGFLWFGTPEGLNRYDSRTFRVYKNDPSNPRSISSDWVLCSLYDSHHTLWIGTYNGLNKYQPNTDSFQAFYHNPTAKSSLSNNRILCMYEDRKGRIWVGTANGLNRLTNSVTNHFDHFFFPGAGQNRINSITEDKEGTLWLATDNGLISMTIDQNTIHYTTLRHNKAIPGSLSENLVTAIVTDLTDKIWVGTKSGNLECYDPATESFIHFRSSVLAGNLSTNNEINCMHVDRTGTIWIGTVEGIIQFEPASKKFTHFKNDPDNPQSLADNSVYSIYRDKQGSIWVGTYYTGVNVAYPNNTPFNVLTARRPAKSLTNKRVNCIAEDRNHNLWIGADGDGLDYLNRQTGSRVHYEAGTDPLKSLPSNQIKGIYVDGGGYTWVGMRRGGLSRMAPDHRSWTTYHVSSVRDSDNVDAMLEDSQKRFWLLTDSGLNLFSRIDGTCRLFKPKKDLLNRSASAVTTFSSAALFEDSQKNIWIGSQEGVNLLKYGSNQLEWLPFKTTKQNANLLAHGSVYSIHEDSKGNIWVGTRFDGLKRFDARQRRFINYGEAYGLPVSTIRAIQSDTNGILWFDTNYELIRFNTETKKSHIYTNSDGIPGSEFETNASFRGHNGRLYFGSNDGLLYFDPLAIKINMQRPNVVFTGLEVLNKPVKVGDETSLLPNDIALTDRLTFNYQQDYFTISFAVLNYIKSEKNQYAYKLDGLDQEWHYTSTPSVTYNNLPSGTYTLLVKGANNDGVWSIKPAQIRINVLPPFWRTWWAYAFYFLTFVIILYFILRSFWLKNTFLREQELHQAKLDFFTNISHEIRTHLTLIIGPIDVLLRSKKDDKEIQKQLSYAKNSSNSLLSLVTELMDFRKAESKQLSLHVSKNNIVEFINSIIVSFNYLSEKRNINFSFSSNKDNIVVWFDPEQLSKVIYNILSNAYKFISDGGEIGIDIEEKPDFVAIKISDNGKGISEENAKKLFNNYFQVYDYGVKNTGYGIGLALSRTITELHQGTLSVDSREAQDGQNGFTCFTIRLRKGHHHFTKDQLVATTSQTGHAGIKEDFLEIPSETEPEFEKSHTILLVEDNDELRGFLKGILFHQYHVLEAAAGQDGWEIATNRIPDLIISDIMMVGMDGLELCRRLKSDERTSHIPIILITAKAALDNQIVGLETGADGYIAKPVNLQVLTLKIRNLLNARELMQQKYGQQIAKEPQNIPIATTSVDEKFIRKIIQITEQHMSNPAFGVELLTTEVGMSTPVLYKKLKALTNMSVNDFTKSIRMKKAAQLLQQGHLNINEVAYEVGFDDRRYFSREFKKVFGLNPSDYAKGAASLN